MGRGPGIILGDMNSFKDKNRFEQMIMGEHFKWQLVGKAKHYGGIDQIYSFGFSTVPNSVIMGNKGGSDHKSFYADLSLGSGVTGTATGVGTREQSCWERGPAPVSDQFQTPVSSQCCMSDHLRIVPVTVSS